MDSAEETSKSLPSTQRKYNKNATIFHPYNHSTSFRLKCSNLPDSINMDDFVDFMKSVSKDHELVYDDLSFTVLKFGSLMEGEQDNFAVVEIYNGVLCYRWIDILQGYKWNNKRIDVSLVSEMPDPSPYLTGPTQYYNPYMLSYPYPYSNFYSFSSSVSSYPSFNNLTPKHSSRRSSYKSIDSRRSSRSESTGSTTKPVPPFLLNLVNGNTSTDNEMENSESENEVASQLDTTTIKDDDGNDVKVNLCRLFVGNIPYSSTWPALKNFIISTCEKMEPNNNIQVLKVEIPVQTNGNIQPISTNNPMQISKYPYLPTYNNNLKHPARQNSYRTSEDISLGKSRGFAIVTTANQESSSKIIDYLDNVIFEGRSLTVRYDKFPDFNNYTLQQLFPYNNSKLNNKSSVLSHLAFERNSFQQKFYYGNNSPVNNFQNPLLYYGLVNNGSMTNFNQASFPRPYASNLPVFPNYFPHDDLGSHNSNQYSATYEVPRVYESKKTDSVNNSSEAIEKHTNPYKENNPTDMDDDEKARELVNSLNSFKLSS